MPTAAEIYKYSSGVLKGRNPSPPRKIVYNPQGNVDHTTPYDALLLMKNPLNLSVTTDDMARQANGIAAFILSKQTFNYTDAQKRPTPYLEKLSEMYDFEDELESIFYTKQPMQVANGALVVENTIA
jgi:hypothetical protein